MRWWAPCRSISTSSTSSSSCCASRAEVETEHVWSGGPGASRHPADRPHAVWREQAPGPCEIAREIDEGVQEGDRSGIGGGARAETATRRHGRPPNRPRVRLLQGLARGRLEPLPPLRDARGEGTPPSEVGRGYRTKTARSGCVRRCAPRSVTRTLSLNAMPRAPVYM